MVGWLGGWERPVNSHGSDEEEHAVQILLCQRRPCWRDAAVASGRHFKRPYLVCSDSLDASMGHEIKNNKRPLPHFRQVVAGQTFFFLNDSINYVPVVVNACRQGEWNHYLFDQLYLFAAEKRTCSRLYSCWGTRYPILANANIFSSWPPEILGSRCFLFYFIFFIFLTLLPVDLSDGQERAHGAFSVFTVWTLQNIIQEVTLPLPADKLGGPVLDPCPVFNNNARTQEMLMAVNSNSAAFMKGILEWWMDVDYRGREARLARSQSSAVFYQSQIRSMSALFGFKISITPQAYWCSPSPSLFWVWLRQTSNMFYPSGFRGCFLTGS